jgi:hypothetical protein
MAYESSKTGVSAGDGNWSGDMADAIFAAGEGFSDQAAAKRKDALAADALALNADNLAYNRDLAVKALDLSNKRYKTEQDRLDVTAKGLADTAALKLAKKNWIIDSTANFDLYAFKKNKAKKSGGLDALTAKYGNDGSHGAQKQYMKDEAALIAAMPVWKEGVLTEYEQEYTKLFGEKLDSSLLETMVKDVPSHTAQQAAEDANVAGLNAQRKADRDYALATTKVILGEGKTTNNSTTSTGNVSKAKKNITYGQVKVAPMVKALFQDREWYKFTGGDLPNSYKLAGDMFKSYEEQGTPAYLAVIAVEKALDSLMVSGDLKEINNDLKKAFVIGNAAIKSYQVGDDATNSSNSRRNVVLNELYDRASEGVKRYSSKDIKKEALKPFQKYIDTMNGVVPTSETVTTGEKSKVGTTSTDTDAALSALITGNLGINTSTTDKYTKPGELLPALLSREELLNGSRSQTTEEAANWSSERPGAYDPTLATSSAISTNHYMDATRAAGSSRKDNVEGFVGSALDWLGLSKTDAETKAISAEDLFNKRVNSQVMEVEDKIDELPERKYSTLAERHLRDALSQEIDVLEKSRDIYKAPPSVPTASAILPAPTTSALNGTGNQAFAQKDINKLQNELLPKNSNYSLADVVDNLDVFLQKNPKPEFVSMLQNLVRYNRQGMDPLLVKAIVQLTT